MTATVKGETAYVALITRAATFVTHHVHPSPPARRHHRPRPRIHPLPRINHSSEAGEERRRNIGPHKALAMALSSISSRRLQRCGSLPPRPYFIPLSLHNSNLPNRGVNELKGKSSAPPICLVYTAGKNTLPLPGTRFSAARAERRVRHGNIMHSPRRTKDQSNL